jgi:hypothetical protein
MPLKKEDVTTLTSKRLQEMPQLTATNYHGIHLNMEQVIISDKILNYIHSINYNILTFVKFLT